MYTSNIQIKGFISSWFVVDMHFKVRKLYYILENEQGNQLIVDEQYRVKEIVK